MDSAIDKRWFNLKPKARLTTIDKKTIDMLNQVLFMRSSCAAKLNEYGCDMFAQEELFKNIEFCDNEIKTILLIDN